MEEDDSQESPWDGEQPTYRAVPEINPKTGKPVQFYACELCGGAVVSRKIHSEHHRRGGLSR